MSAEQTQDPAAGQGPRRGFASDNAATIHPAVLAAIGGANNGHAFGYGHDQYTHEVERKLAAALGDPGASVYFVFNGTGANVLSMRAALAPWQAAIVSENAHLHTDEVGAPERVAGNKLLVLPSPDGRLRIEDVERELVKSNDEHFVKPGMVSLTQSTELGTLYPLEDVRAICELAHRHGVLVHIDGARIANAAAAQGVSLHEVSVGCGVDLLSFGGTKNGLMGAEAVVVFSAGASGRAAAGSAAAMRAADDTLTRGMLHLRKQSLQLASKMRFLAAQFDALISAELWRVNAAHANQMAQLLADTVQAIPGVQLTRRPQVNAVFATIPAAARIELQKQFDFYEWDESSGEVRWMCSWDTTEQDIQRFTQALRQALGA